MALKEEFESRGNWLFKKRSFLPLVLYVLATIVLFIDRDDFIDFRNDYWEISCFLVSMLGLAIRAITIGFAPAGTSGRNVHGQVAETLNTQGIYSTVRHPLYLGNFFMWFGIIMYTGNAWFILVAALIFWLYYEKIMFAEEEFLRKKYGSTYETWAAKTPAFIPDFSKWTSAKLEFSFKNVLKREFYGLFAVGVSFAYINFLKNYIELDRYHIHLNWIVVVVVTFVIFIVLRTIKKTTQLLNVEGR